MGVRINGVWHEELADPGTGGSDSGNGRNFTDMGQYSQGGGQSVSSGGTSSSGGGGTPVYQTSNGPKTVQQMEQELRSAGWPGPIAGTGGPGAIANAYAQTTGGAVSEISGQNYGASAQNQSQQSNGNSLDAQYQKMLQALASGNREAFEFEKQQFNMRFDEAKREFDLGRSDSLDQFAKNYALSLSEVTGQYNGQPTEQARQFNVGVGQSLLDAATKIRGPRDYLQYQQFTRGGQNLLQQLGGNQPIPTGAAPTGPLQSANIQTVLQDLGILPGGQMQGPGVGDQLLQRFGLQSGQQLSPNDVNPARWDMMGQIGRDLTKNLAETRFGYDPTDFEAQVNAQRPMGTAATTNRRSYGALSGLF